MSKVFDNLDYIALYNDARDDPSLRPLLADYMEDHGEYDLAEAHRCPHQEYNTHKDAWKVVGGPWVFSPGTASSEAISGGRKILLRDVESKKQVTYGDNRLRIRLTHGFIDSVDCSWNFWQLYGPAIVKRHPVGHVQTCRTPALVTFGSAYGWVCQRLSVVGILQHVLPGHIWDQLDNWRTRPGLWKIYASDELANKALSDALIAGAQRSDTKILI